MNWRMCYFYYFFLAPNAELILESYRKKSAGFRRVTQAHKIIASQKTKFKLLLKEI